MKVRTKPRIAVIFNRDFEGAEGDPENRAREDIRNVATEVADVLDQAGYDTLRLGVRDDLPAMLAALRDPAPVTVFNLCESLRGDNRFEALVPMLLEFEGVVYTGSPPTTLLSALHKDRTKQLLLAAGVPTPRSLTFTSADISDLGDLRFPLIVKPTREDASVGISSASVVATPAELESRVRHVLMHYNQPAIVEEYILGREINASILERPGGQPEVFPLHEIDFSDMPTDRPKIVSFEAKWVEDSPDFRGTRPVPCVIRDEIRERITQVALAGFRAVGVRDYGRVDLRLAGDGTPFVIDVNPNCDLSSQGGGFARAARAAGLTYADLVLRLLALALERRKDADTIPLAVRPRSADRAARPKARSGQDADVKSVSPGGGGLRHRAPRGRAGSA